MPFHSLGGTAYLFILSIGTELIFVFSASKRPITYKCVWYQNQFNIYFKKLYTNN